MLKVNTIYPAFMGEANCLGIGVPCTFIRLAGCNLRCYLKTKRITCDTPEALDVSCGTDMSEEDIVKKVLLLKRNVICLTGGEPLMQDVHRLLELLSIEGCHVVIETNGSQDILPYRSLRNVSFVVDYKNISSGENEKMLKSNWLYMGKRDYLKFVIDTYEDYGDARKWLIENPGFKGNVAFGLFWGSHVSYQDLMSWMIEDRLSRVYLNMQTHKMACLYDKFRGTEEIDKIFIPRNL